jgi:hypothetical protein
MIKTLFAMNVSPTIFFSYYNIRNVLNYVHLLNINNVFRFVRLGCEHGCKYYEYPDMKKNGMRNVHWRKVVWSYVTFSTYISYIDNNIYKQP